MRQMPPKVIGPYSVLSTLGKGGIGTVYRALDSRSGEEVALKLLSTGPALDSVVAKRLVREFEALAELSHPNVVRVFDAGVHHGYPYLVMELVEGLDLRTYLSVDLADTPAAHARTPDTPSDQAYDPTADGSIGEERRPFDVDAMLEEADTDEYAAAAHRGARALRDYARTADEPDTDAGLDSGTYSRSSASVSRDILAEAPADLVFDGNAARIPKPGPVPLEQLNRPERIGRLKDAILQICEALAYIHGHGFVHRDIKPGNILVDDDRRVRLMDFGLAKHLADDANVTAAGHVVGTYRYMAPEQAMGEWVDGRSDLYALGVVIYELLAGRLPYDADTPIELWQQILESEPYPLELLNPDVDEDLAQIAHRLLRKDPWERFQTAEEIFELLVG
jgi:serine/threonine protein kinase